VRGGGVQRVSLISSLADPFFFLTPLLVDVIFFPKGLSPFFGDFFRPLAFQSNIPPFFFGTPTRSCPPFLQRDGGGHPPPPDHGYDHHPPLCSPNDFFVRGSPWFLLDRSPFPFTFSYRSSISRKNPPVSWHIPPFPSASSFPNLKEQGLFFPS